MPRVFHHFRDTTRTRGTWLSAASFAFALCWKPIGPRPARALLPVAPGHFPPLAPRFSAWKRTSPRPPTKKNREPREGNGPLSHLRHRSTRKTRHKQEGLLRDLRPTRTLRMAEKWRMRRFLPTRGTAVSGLPGSADALSGSRHTAGRLTRGRNDARIPTSQSTAGPSDCARVRSGCLLRPVSGSLSSSPARAKGSEACSTQHAADWLSSSRPAELAQRACLLEGQGRFNRCRQHQIGLTRWLSAAVTACSLDLLRRHPNDPPISAEQSSFHRHIWRDCTHPLRQRGARPHD